MQGVYKGIKCRTGEQRIDGVWQKALIYDCKPQGDDEQALTQAGFVDMENGLWVKVLTAVQYRELAAEFEKRQEKEEQERLLQRQRQSEQDIKLEQRRHVYNEKMASRRAKLRVLKIEFEGASIFAVAASLALIFMSVLNRSDPDLKTTALPLWASLTFLPVIIAGAAVAAYKKLPEAYLVLAALLLAAALIAWDTASIVLFIMAAAFVVFYFITRCISSFKKEPEYPMYPDKTTEEFRLMM